MTGTDIQLSFAAPPCLAQDKVISDRSDILQGMIEIPGDIDITDHVSDFSFFYYIAILCSKGKILSACLASFTVKDV